MWCTCRFCMLPQSDSASHPVEESAGGVCGRLRLRAAFAGFSSACCSRSLDVDLGQEYASLIRRKQAVIPRQRLQQGLRIAAIHVSAGEEVGADHLQKVASRLVGARHQIRGLTRLFDYGDLALIDLEKNQLRGFTVQARQFPFHFPSEFRFRHPAGPCATLLHFRSAAPACAPARSAVMGHLNRHSYAWV